MQLTEDLKWRYATKKFDAHKKISAADLQQLQEAIRLSASSFGLQPYKVVIISDPVLREQLKAASWGQEQLTMASHLVVFCNYTQLHAQHVDDLMTLTAREQSLEVQTLEVYGSMMKNTVVQWPALQQQQWAARQAYLALGTLLVACASMRIDACPMEGFEASKYNSILGLTEQGLNAAVIAAIGYRASDDVNARAPKVRKPMESLFQLL